MKKQISSVVVLVMSALSGFAGAEVTNSESDAAVASSDERAGASADQAYADAQAFERRGEFVAALQRIDDGIALDPNHLRLLRLRAEIWNAKRDCVEELAAWRAYLDAGARGANRRKAAKIVARLDHCQTTFLQISVTDGPAQVFIDSRRLGVWCVADPVCKKQIDPRRRYTVYVERDGFRPVRKRVKLEANATYELPVVLVENPSALTVAVTPADAAVTIDGALYDRGMAQLAAGEHVVDVSRPGFVPYAGKFSARGGQPVSIDVALIERTSPPGLLALDRAPVVLREKPRVPERAAVRPAVPEQATRVVDRGREWTGVKLGTVATVGVVSAAAYGWALMQGLKGRRLQREAWALCAEESGRGLVCNTDALDRNREARAAAAAGNLAFTAGTVAGLGALWAVNMNERAREGMSLRRKLSVGAAGGVALAGIGVGVVYRLRARSHERSAAAACSGATCAGDELVARIEGQQARKLSNLGFAAAGAGAVSAAVLWLTAPDGRRSGTRVTPVVGVGRIGITFDVSF